MPEDVARKEYAQVVKSRPLGMYVVGTFTYVPFKKQKEIDVDDCMSRGYMIKDEHDKENTRQTEHALDSIQSGGRLLHGTTLN